MNSAIQGIGSMANGALDMAAEAQNQDAKAKATIQQMINVEEQMEKMRRESNIKILNGYVETANQVRV